MAAAILGLAVPLDGWLAALIVGAALFVIAGIAAVVVRKEAAQARPPIPVEAVQSINDDVRAIEPGGQLLSENRNARPENVQPEPDPSEFDAIRADIEQTRAELADIGEKAGPRAQRAAEAVAPYRGKIIAGTAAALVVLLIVRRRRSSVG